MSKGVFDDGVGAGCLAILIALPLVLAFFAVISAFFGWIFMLVWNFAVVSAFNAPVLDFWHAWGIWFLICLVGRCFRSFTTTSSKKD